MPDETPKQDIEEQAQEQQDQVLQREGVEKELMGDDQSEAGERIDEVE